MSKVIERVERKANVFAIGELRLIVDLKEEENILGSTNRRYSGGYKGKSPKRGISLQDEKKYPQLAAAIGISTSDPGWAQASNNYWAEFSQIIDFGKINDKGKVEGGREINASYEVWDSGEVYVDDLDDFALFNLMQDDKKVSIHPDQFSNKSNYDFFCIDVTVEAARTKELMKARFEANIAFTKLFNDAGLPEQEGKLRILAGSLDPEISSVHASTLTKDEALASILTVIEKEPSKFLSAIEDKNLSVKEYIKRCVEANIFQQIGNKYIYQNESFESRDELITWLKSANSTEERTKIKAHLEDFVVIA